MSLLLLSAGTSMALWGFLAFGTGGRHISVIGLAAFLGYMLGRSFAQNKLESASLGWLLAFVAGPIYGVWLEPFVENPFHDASSIMALIGCSAISSTISSAILASAGWLLHVSAHTRARRHMTVAQDKPRL
jgi:hypothetical protein